MPIRNLLRLSLVCMFSALLLAPASRTVAQDASGTLDAQGRAQLAAIPLTADQLPDGYRLQSESFLTADQVASDPDGALTAEALVNSGFVGMYASVYTHESGSARITSYVSQWSSPESAASGFLQMEDDASDSTDAELAAGDGPSELTTGTSNVNGQPAQLIDATFVVGSYLVGVSSEGSQDRIVDSDGMTALAETLEGRANTVSDGGAPDGIDLALATSTLDVTNLGTEVQAGFLSPDEAESLYGLSGSSLGNLQSSWVSLVAAGDGASAPYIVVGRTQFEDGNTAGRVVAQAGELVPVTVSLEPVTDLSVEGVDRASGFTYVSPATPDAGGANSFRIVAQVGDMLVIVDVQGAATVDEARSAATELLNAQLSCSEGGCTAPELPLGA